MFRLSDKMFDALKWLTMVFLPAIVMLYISLGEVWNLPKPDEISGTIAALIVFLGIFLQINSAQFRLTVALERGKAFVHNLKLRFVMTDQFYDSLKWITTILLPGLSTLYVAVAVVWDFPFSGEVSGTITAIVMFMSALLQISSLEFKTSMGVLMDHDYTPFNQRGTGLLGMTSDFYDILKFVAQGFLPGAATFYVALALIWGLPYSEQVSGTVMAVVMFMNALLQISTAKFRATNQ